MVIMYVYRVVHVYLLEVAKQLHVLKYVSVEVYKCIHAMEVHKVITTTVASSRL